MTFDFLALLGGENRTRLGLAPEMNAGVCNLHRRGEATNLRQKRRSRRRCFHNQWGKLPMHASASISIRIILSLDDDDDDDDDDINLRPRDLPKGIRTC